VPHHCLRMHIRLFFLLRLAVLFAPVHSRAPRDYNYIFFLVKYSTELIHQQRSNDRKKKRRRTCRVRTERSPCNVFLTGHRIGRTPLGHREFSSSLGVCTCVHAYNHSNHEPYISSRRADEDEKKPTGMEGLAEKEGSRL